MYFNHRLGQGVWSNFGPEVVLDVRYHLLHPVDVLTCIAARGIGGTCRSRVCLDARQDEKHLDDAGDGKLQFDRAEGGQCAPVSHSHNICRVIGKRKGEAVVLFDGFLRGSCH